MIRLWKEKRGEIEPMDLTAITSLSNSASRPEALNRSWYERSTGRVSHRQSSAGSSIR